VRGAHAGRTDRPSRDIRHDLTPARPLRTDARPTPGHENPSEITCLTSSGGRWLRDATVEGVGSPSRVLLVVHHTPSPSVQMMLESVLAGTGTEEIEGVEVRVRAALAATAVDVLEADGFVLGTPANIGYMSGALKHFFDQIYYPCLSARVGAPYGVYVHGNTDTTGALRSVQSIVTGLGWEQVHRPVAVVGEPSSQDLEACWDLGATVAATLMSE
jgi:flavorubredoxin